LFIFLVIILDREEINLLGKKSEEERKLSIDHIPTLKITDLGVNEFHLMRGVL
jgi:hypothetical protein